MSDAGRADALLADLPRDGRAHPWLARFATFAHRHGLNIPGDDS